MLLWEWQWWFGIMVRIRLRGIVRDVSRWRGKVVRECVVEDVYGEWNYGGPLVEAAEWELGSGV